MEGNRDNWRVTKDFLKMMVDYFEIGQDAVRVGLIVFSEFARNAHYLEDWDRRSLIADIDSLSFLDSITNTTGAIRTAIQDQFVSYRGDRSGVQVSYK